MSIMFARPDLRGMPPQMRRYILDWFRPGKIFDMDVLFAAGRLHMRWQDYQQRGRKPGFAPVHAVDIREYTGLDLHDEKTSQWIQTLCPPEEPLVHVIDED